MANKIVDVDSEDLKDVDYSDLTSRLESEEKTSEEARQAETQGVENKPIGGEESEFPLKFKGKPVDEILNSYQNLEQQYG